MVVYSSLWAGTGLLKTWCFPEHSTELLTQDEWNQLRYCLYLRDRPTKKDNLSRWKITIFHCLFCLLCKMNTNIMLSFIRFLGRPLWSKAHWLCTKSECQIKQSHPLRNEKLLLSAWTNFHCQLRSSDLQLYGLPLTLTPPPPQKKKNAIFNLDFRFAVTQFTGNSQWCPEETWKWITCASLICELLITTVVTHTGLRPKGVSVYV